MPAAQNNQERRNNADLDLLLELGKEAGQIALRYFKKDPQTWMKQGDSPVTEADFAVDTFLKKNLLDARPDYGWLSEETEDTSDRLERVRTFVVDPIDGTRGFINGMDQWCVSIAVVEARRPVVGLLECPVLDQTISATDQSGAALNGVPLSLGESVLLHRTRMPRVTGPKHFLKSMLQTDLGEFEKVSFVPSLAYRIGMVAMGDLDVAVARGSARDWDLAAADLIVHEAGGCLTDMQGIQLSYNCPSTRQGALVSSVASHHGQMLRFAQQAMDHAKD